MPGLDLPLRTAKPRAEGLTAITDTGLSIHELRGILEDYAALLDIAKLGVGSAYTTPRLAEKIALYREYGVEVYFGGTLFEKFTYQGKLAQYLEMLRHYGVTWLEVSNGTLDTSLAERVQIVEQLCDKFTIVGEVGCKDANKIMPPSQWIAEMKALLAAGCTYVITEGRDSGTAGVYRANGEIRTGLVADMIAAVDPRRIIFEAPKAQAQMFFINQMGPNVNLGNVAPRELLLLETQRVGLRNETFFLSAESL